MVIEITHVRYGSLPKTEQTISHFQWRELGSTNAGTTDNKQTLVKSLEGGNKAFIRSGSQFVAVVVVNATPKYLRSLGDGQVINNLASLPEF